MSAEARMQREPSSAKQDYSRLVPLLLYLIGALVMWGYQKASIDQHTQEIHELQQNTVSRREMDNVNKQLGRIEDKLDKLSERK